CCPICLDRFNNMAYLDLCLHKFCFRCIHEWSKNKAECPLCKQPFNSIYHKPTRALLLSIRDSDSESSLGEECGAVSQ
uniref:E3 ubiquitin-protein ligase Topors n=1 Tax=Salmo trutta TaxID=8032 RepID=A0A673VYJ9_SALTR